MATLTFLGAARTVTGSKYLLELDNTRILVDCGLFQGLKDLRLRNWSPLPVAPDTIDAVVVDPADYERTVKTLLTAGSDPVITKEPEGAWTHAVTDKALGS